MPRKNRERNFLTELKNSFAKHNVFWFKIPDSPIYKGMKTRFTGAKPFDSFLVYSGVPVAIEAKYLSDFKSFGLKQLQPSQIENLERFENAGGVSFIFLNVRRLAKPDNFQSYANKLLIFPWGEFKKRKKPFSMIELTDRKQWNGKNGLFPVKQFLKSLHTFINNEPQFKT